MSLDQLIATYAAQLRANGLPVDRLATSVQTLHPEVFSRTVRWTFETGAEIAFAEHGILQTPAFLDSPIAAIQQGAPFVRCRIVGGGPLPAYPIIHELAAAGVTDYAIYPFPFGKNRSYVSFATKSPAGFSETQLAALLASVPDLARELYADYLHYALDSLVSVYLGANVAKRVLAGNFRRGSGEVVTAALWSCDLRGFTELSDQRPPREVATLLDAYFDAVASPIEAAGGEILKFIGDAVLAMFPLGETPNDVCQRVLAAALAAQNRLAAVSETNTAAGLPELRMGIGLHVGEVFYGNVGSKGRLDFTVIGAAVNELARVESMCKTLGVSLLATDDFCKHLDAAQVTSCGAHELRGSRGKRELFTLK